MAVSSKPKLRERLSRVFSELFVDDTEALGVIHAFLSSKKVKKSVQTDVRKVGCAQDYEDDRCGNSAFFGDHSSPRKDVAKILCCLGTVVDVSQSERADNEDVDVEVDIPGQQHGHAEIKGQSIIGLFGAHNNEHECFVDSRFSNGDDVNLEHYLQSFVETPTEKEHSKKAFAAEKYVPSDALLVASLNCFSRKKKRHFFRDGLYLCVVFASEMKMSLSTFLRVRGWLARNTKGKISISYRRIEDCLRLLGGDVALNYYRVSAVFDRLFKVINSRDIWPEMPFEKGEFFYG